MNLLKMAMLGALAACAGCATKEMKSTPLYTGSEVTYTGAVEDRVNLWPLAYYREPVGSILWPVLSFSDDQFAVRPLYSQYKQDGKNGVYDEFNVLWPIAQADLKHDEYRIFPVLWGDDYFALFPEFWWNRHSVGLLPFAMDRDLDWLTVFPVFWADLNGAKQFNTLFPLYYYSQYENTSKDKPTTYDRHFWLLAGLAGFNIDEDRLENHRVLPFYAVDDDGFYSIPYTHTAHGRREATYLLAGLAGTTATNGVYTSSWCAPFYYHDQDAFVSPIYGKTRDADWLLPVYYRGPNHFVTPLYGKTSDIEWMLPLYWKDEAAFLSLAYCQQMNKAGEVTRALVPPLLSAYTHDKTDGDAWRVLLGLGGYDQHPDGTFASWVLPFYYANDDMFITPLFGKTKTSDWIVPLYYRDDEYLFVLGLYGQHKDASWLMPLYYKDDEKFVTPLFGKTKESDWILPLYYRDGDSFVTPLGGGTPDSHWILPLYYKEGGDFLSIPYCRKAEGAHTDHLVPPLLSSWTTATNGAVTSVAALLGVAGWEANTDGETVEDWILPLYGREKDEWFISLPYGYAGGGSSQTNTWWATPLVGTRDGKTTGGWVFPFVNVEKDRNWAKFAALARAETLPDWVTFPLETRTNVTWRATPAPDAVKGNDLDGLLADLDVVARDGGAKSIPAPAPARQPQARYVVTNIVVRPKAQYHTATEKRTFGLAARFDDKVWAHASGSNNASFDVDKSFHAGNSLVAERETHEIARFDVATRKKVGTKTSAELSGLVNFFFKWKHTEDKLSTNPEMQWESTEVGLLAVLYNGNRTTHGGKMSGSANVLGILYDSSWNEESSRASVLWRVWHREENNGNVSIDMFPGFTYDAKENGYRKTSFLWRLWRYEEDPHKGTSVDFFFLPVKRP